MKIKAFKTNTIELVMCKCPSCDNYHLVIREINQVDVDLKFTLTEKQRIELIEFFKSGGELVGHQNVTKLSDH
jgi:hypothetical protein